MDIKDMTLKEKLDYYWYYYKWHIIVILCVIVAVAYTLYGCMTRVKPDLTVVYVSVHTLNEESEAAFEREFSGYVDDVNNDGQRVVDLSVIQYAQATGMDDLSFMAALETKLTAEMMVGEGNLYIFSKEFTEIFDYYSFFRDVIPLSGTRSAEIMKLTSDDFFCGIRVEPEDNSDKGSKQYANAEKLFNELKK